MREILLLVGKCKLLISWLLFHLTGKLIEHCIVVIYYCMTKVLVAVSKLIAMGQDSTSMSRSLIALKKYVSEDKALVVWWLVLVIVFVLLYQPKYCIVQYKIHPWLTFIRNEVKPVLSGHLGGIVYCPFNCMQMLVIKSNSLMKILWYLSTFYFNICIVTLMCFSTEKLCYSPSCYY